MCISCSFTEHSRAGLTVRIFHWWKQWKQTACLFSHPLRYKPSSSSLTPPLTQISPASHYLCFFVPSLALHKEHNYHCEEGSKGTWLGTRLILCVSCTMITHFGIVYQTMFNLETQTFRITILTYCLDVIHQTHHLNSQLDPPHLLHEHMQCLGLIQLMW